LTDAQLLAILLRVGRQRSSAVQVSMEVLIGLAASPVWSIAGSRNCVPSRESGRRRPRRSRPRLELGKRSLASPLSTGTRVSSSRVLFEHYHPALRNLRHEIFKVVLLRRQACDSARCHRIRRQLDA
jgi:DNA repair protein RadC